MAGKWYPVINYESCIECGACVDRCTHGVYKTGTNKPMVIYTDGCIDGCRGCQKLCPTDSIEYFGDTGEASSCGCSSSCN